MKHTALIRIASLLLALCLLTLGNLFAVSANDGSSSEAGQPRTAEEILGEIDLGRTKPFTAEEKAILHEYLVAQAAKDSVTEGKYYLESDFLASLHLSSGRETVTVTIHPDGTRTSTSTAYPQPYAVEGDWEDLQSTEEEPEDTTPVSTFIPYFLERTERIQTRDPETGRLRFSRLITVKRVTEAEPGTGITVEKIVECYILSGGVRTDLMDAVEFTNDAPAPAKEEAPLDPVVSAAVRGDGDGNGNCDVFDAVLILSYIVSPANAPLTETGRNALNVDGSDKVDVFDAVGILTYIVKGAWD